MDRLRQWSPAIVNNVTSFVVNETTRIAGCAEVMPSYDLSVSRKLVENAHTT
jgi:hypothetical protein